MTVMVPQTLYGMIRNLVTINDLWFPIPYMECRNLVTVNDCYGSPYLIWNAGTLYLSMTVMVPIPYNRMQELCIYQ